VVLEMARAYSAAERALDAIAKKKKKEKDKASEEKKMKALALAEGKRLVTKNRIALNGLNGQDAGAVLTLTPEAAAAGRGLHSSTSQLSLSRFCHSKCTVNTPSNTP
jgi:hypothetical protein